MTDDEYGQWYRNHVAHFPEFDAWLARKPDADTITAVWRRTLSRASLDDATDATVQLYGRDTQSPYGRHAVIVAGICRDQERRRRQTSLPRYAGGEQTYECLRCLDQGRVSVWRRKSMDAARNGTLGEAFTVYTCAVACDCRAGEDHGWLTRYDPAKMLLCTPRESHEAELQELRDFVAAMPTKVREPQEWTPN